MTGAFFSGTILTGCQSSAQKEAAARDNLKEAKQELKEVRKDANADAQKLADAREAVLSAHVFREEPVERLPLFYE